MRSPRRHPALSTAAIVALIVFALTSLSKPASAHQVGLSRGEYAIAPEHVEAKLTLARRDIVAALPEVDGDRDGSLTQAELDAHRAAIEAFFVDRTIVTAAGAPCEGKLVSAALEEPDGAALDLAYTCETISTAVSIDATFVGALGSGHRHLAHVTGGKDPFDDVLFDGKTKMDLGLPPPTKRAVAWSFLKQGVEHILTGFDHLAFLFGLILVGGRLRSVLGMVTAFTVAHSITLALAVLGVFAPSPRFIEPAIALSVAYVGVENFFVKDVRGRWRITLPFGLIHGFGFAGALGQIHLPKPDVPLALATFNVGVEIGQLAFLGAVIPLVFGARWAFHRLLRALGYSALTDWFDRWVKRVLSAAIVVVALVWFVQRVIAAPG